MTNPQTPGTKYGSEETWRRSLAMQFDNLGRFSLYPPREIHQIYRRIARIRTAGLPEWQVRYEADADAGMLPAVSARPGRGG